MCLRVFQISFRLYSLENGQNLFVYPCAQNNPLSRINQIFSRVELLRNDCITVSETYYTWFENQLKSVFNCIHKLRTNQQEKCASDRSNNDQCELTINYLS